PVPEDDRGHRAEVVEGQFAAAAEEFVAADVPLGWVDIDGLRRHAEPLLGVVHGVADEFVRFVSIAMIAPGEVEESLIHAFASLQTGFDYSRVRMSAAGTGSLRPSSNSISSRFARIS